MDDRDNHLIELLIEDPRSTLSKLAKKMNISVPAVSKRLNKLQKNSVIKFEVSLNLQEFKMTHAFMFIETNDARSRSGIIDRFSKCPLVDKIFDLVGWEYHLAVLLISPDATLLSNFMTYCPIRYMEGIKRINGYYSLLETHSPMFMPVSFKRSKNNGSCGTDCVTECLRYKKQCPGCPAIEYETSEKIELPV